MGVVRGVAAQRHPESKIAKVYTSNSEEPRMIFNPYFTWFNDHFTGKFLENSTDFFNVNFKFHLLGIMDRPSLLWKGNDYFVTQIELEDSCSVYMRVSDDIAETFMEKALGERFDKKKPFSLKNLTELEAFILTSFNEFLFKKLDNAFIDNRSIVSIAENLVFVDEDLIHLTFYVYNPDNPEDEYGKIIFSCPDFILKNLNQIDPSINPVDIEQLYDCYSRVDIIVGKSKSSLEEVKNLEPEDIVMLEKSNINMMILAGDEKLKFPVRPDQSLVLNIDNPYGGNLIMSDPNLPIKNIWDTLQLEITAEFQKIKMSLGDLKQVTEGLVVDVAPIVNNEIFLHVEGRNIATGELVIVGDKYGVKINKLIHEEEDKDEQLLVRDPLMESRPRALETKNKRESRNKPEEVESSQKSTPEEDDDDDFDYSDFDIDDDDDL